MKRVVRNSLSFALVFAAAAITLLVFLAAYSETRLMLTQQQERSDVIEALLDSTDYGYSVIDRNGKILEWNPALERLTQWTETDVKAHGLSVLLTPEVFAMHQRAFAAAFDKPSQHSQVRTMHCKLPVRNREGQTVPVLVTVRIVRTRYGQQYAIAHIDREDQFTEATFTKNHATSPNPKEESHVQSKN